MTFTKRAALCLVLIGLALYIIMAEDVELESLLFFTTLAIASILLEKWSIQLPTWINLSGASLFSFFVFIYYGFAVMILIELLLAMMRTFYRDLSVKDNIVRLIEGIGSMVLAGAMYLLFGGVIGAFEFEHYLALIVATITYSLANGAFKDLFKLYMSTSNKFLPILSEALIVFSIKFILLFRLLDVFQSTHTFRFSFAIFIVLAIFYGIYYVARRYRLLRKSYLNSLESLTFLIENKLALRKGHANRVGKTARLLASHLGLPKNEVNTIHTAALLHDIGKMALHETLFHKRGPLTLTEMKEYERHANISYELVKEITGSEQTAEYVRDHHEHVDGSGFPNKKVGKDLSLGARIIAVANVYDHVCFDEKIANKSEYMMLRAGQQLDPDLVKLGLDLQPFEETERQTLPCGVAKSVVLEPSLQEDTLYDSQLLSKFGATFVSTYDGTFKDDDGHYMSVPNEEKVRVIVEQASLRRKVMHDVIEGGHHQKIYDIYVVPFEEKAIVMFFDVTSLLSYEREQDAKIQKIYREVIYAVTQGKLLLIDIDGIQSLYASTVDTKVEIQTNADVSRCRQAVQQVADELALTKKESFNLILCTSEIVTNVLKHAREGEMSIYHDQEVVRIIVEDQGGGINLADLPKSTLMSGYSSKASLGQGFNLMLKLMERIIIHTSTSGTIVVLEAKLSTTKSDNDATENRSVI